MKKLNPWATYLSNKKSLSRAEMKNVKAGMAYPTIYGTPGGNNGNPCPNYCESVGGQIWCLGNYGGVNYFYEGNCNLQPYNPNLHNACMNDISGNYWC